MSTTLEDLAAALPCLLAPDSTWLAEDLAIGTNDRNTSLRRCPPLVTNCLSDGEVEDLVDTGHLLTAALHVVGTHLLSYRFALLGSDRSQTLCPEEVDAGLLVAEVGLETNQNNGGGGAEVQDLWVPLFDVSVESRAATGKEVLPCP
jgi:hypothetical protein